MRRLRVVNAVGARPNFVKIAPLMAAMRANDAFEARLVHTGQHYDRAMAAVFFEELGIPEPDVNLGVGSGSGSAARQIAEIMVRFEEALREGGADLVVVVGDVNSTLACALTAAKLQIPVAHVEAGLRSFDRTMPEEINRLVTDHVSDLLFVSEPSGLENLRAEGVADEKSFHVGNVMIDTLERLRGRAARSDIRRRLGVEGGDYAVLTLHRPSSVDGGAALGRIFDALEVIQRELPIVFPVHPRTRRRMDELGLRGRIEGMGGLGLVEPLGYVDFLRLMTDARLMLTDSGGIQEETCMLGVPCVVLRENTERPVTLGSGYHVLAGTETERIVSGAREYLSAPRPEPFEIALWDGHAAERIVKVLKGASEALRGDA